MAWMMIRRKILLLLIGISSSCRTSVHGFSVSRQQPSAGPKQTAASSPQTVVQDYLESPEWKSLHPIQQSCRLVPESCLANDSVYRQSNLQVSVAGREEILNIGRILDGDDDVFSQSTTAADPDTCTTPLRTTIDRISTTGPDSIVVHWNITFVPPAAATLELMATLWPGWSATYVTYNHLSHQVSSFSWSRVFAVLGQAWQTAKLPVPLACIQGQTQLQFQQQRVVVGEPAENKKDTTTTTTTTTASAWKVRRITEDLVYGRDLARGALQNRKCAADLRLFLQASRRFAHHEKEQDWEDLVVTALPWSSVPGSGALDVDPMEDDNVGSNGALVLGSVAVTAVVLFSVFVGPLLL